MHEDDDKKTMKEKLHDTAEKVKEKACELKEDIKEGAEELKEKAHEAKESDLDKISVIKEQIANGTYNIDIQKTSQKMAQDLLNI